MFDNNGYGRSSLVEAKVQSASQEQLIVMLMEGFLEEISRLKGHLNVFNDPSSKIEVKSKSLENKGKSITKCIAILRGLDTALDHETGGELVERLHAHYDFMGKQLFEVTKSNNPDQLEPIVVTMTNLHEAWSEKAA